MISDDSVRERYEAALRVEEQARAHLYDAAGNLLPVIRGPDGDLMPNPYLSEWHRAVQTVKSLAHEVDDDADGGPLLAAVLSGNDAEILQTLSVVLAGAIDGTRGHGLAALSRVFLDAQRELRELKEGKPSDNVVGDIISRKTNPNARRLSIV